MEASSAEFEKESFALLVLLMQLLLHDPEPMDEWRGAVGLVVLVIVVEL